jgi:hypothetical protein
LKGKILDLGTSLARKSMAIGYRAPSFAAWLRIHMFRDNLL